MSARFLCPTSQDLYLYMRHWRPHQVPLKSLSGSKIKIRFPGLFGDPAEPLWVLTVLSGSLCFSTWFTEVAQTCYHFLTLQCLGNKVTVRGALWERWGGGNQHSSSRAKARQLSCARIVLKVSVTKMETFAPLQVSGSSTMLHKPS